jgi:P pilus assembly chaperone PapD
MHFKYFIAILLASFLGGALPAVARIDIVPQKVVIENRERNGELTVLNLMNRAGTFRVELVHYVQDENGVYEGVEEPLNPNFDPQKIVRFSPRQFRIESGGRQKIRISLRKPADLPEGEYRFHVKATRLAQEDEKRALDPDNVNVVANIGVTIPVVVRHGKIDSSAKLSDVKIVRASPETKNRPELHVKIERSGNASTLGVIEVFWQGSSNKEKRIGYIKNMNVFTDVERRFAKIPLSEMPVGKGTVRVRYTDGVNKGSIFDEVKFPL